MRSLEFVGFSYSEFVLIVEYEEDVVVTPWYVLGFTEVWVVATVRVDFALFSGNIKSAFEYWFSKVFRDCCARESERTENVPK